MHFGGRARLQALEAGGLVVQLMQQPHIGTFSHFFADQPRPVSERLAAPSAAKRAQRPRRNQC